MDVYRTPDDASAALPGYDFAPHRLEHAGLRMHYVDEGAGEPVLLLHGEPTWSYLWRAIVPRIAAAGRRALAPDLIGFGRSDKPLDPGWHSYDRHVEHVTALVRGLDLRGLTLVVHDWGGPIGLRLAVENEERVDRLVILDTGIGAGRMTDSWLRFRDAVRRVGDRLDVGRLVAAGTARGLPDEIRAAYDAPFPSPETKAGPRAMPDLVPAEPDHPSAPAMIRVREALRSWPKPAFVIWGAEDAVLPPSVGESFVELIPGAAGIETIAGASHFLQEDAPAEVGDAILRCLGPGSTVAS